MHTPERTENPAIGLFLVRLGAVLFLLGLLTGLVTNLMANPRMGLSAHLEGVMNGAFLIALGAAWPHVSLSRALEKTAAIFVSFGAAANWLAVILAAIWNTGAMTPIASPAPDAEPWQELFVSVAFAAVAVTMIAGAAIIVYGLFRKNR